MLPDLAFSSCTAVVSCPREGMASSVVASKSGHCVANDQGLMGYKQKNVSETSIRLLHKKDLTVNWEAFLVEVSKLDCVQTARHPRREGG